MTREKAWPTAYLGGSLRLDPPLPGITMVNENPLVVISGKQGEIGAMISRRGELSRGIDQFGGRESMVPRHASTCSSPRS